MKKIAYIFLGLALMVLLTVSIMARVLRPRSEQRFDERTAQITDVVLRFGLRIKNVALLAPEDQVKSEIREAYTGMLTSELLNQWIANPSQAVGRITSSPWPDHIIVDDVQPIDDRTLVTGRVIEMTSENVTKGGNAGERRITLTVRKEEGAWHISGVNVSPESTSQTIQYRNTQYGFTFDLPESWKGYSVVTSRWEGEAPGGARIATGPTLSIRHPLWTKEKPRQDIPVLIFTIGQWNALNADQFHIGAAPINPSELGRNATYVFAIPARYNYAFPEGFEEVDQILQTHPLKAL